MLLHAIEADPIEIPSGFVDTIIHKWIVEAQSSEVVQSIHQRDMFAAPLSEDGQRCCYMAHEAQVWIDF